jgi:hypothetical protein
MTWLKREKERVNHCKEPDCEKPKSKLGFCNRHYLNYQRHGTPNGKWVMANKTDSIEKRLADKSKLTPENGCVEWVGYIDPTTGYGSLIFNGMKMSAHRASYEKFHGLSISGKQVLHKCDNRKCINPDHLFLGSIEDNMKDKVEKGRQGRGSVYKTAKVTEKQVLVIRNLKKSGFLNKELASLFPMSVRHMARITSGNRWKHVEVAA